MAARLSRPAREWRNIAYQAVPLLVDQRGGAVLWPEVEGILAHQQGWIAQHAPQLGPAKRLDPHILGVAKDLLVDAGVLRAAPSTLQGRVVTAYVDAAAENQRRATEVDRLAARKRRLYRSFLGWTGDAKLCGNIAERHVAASLESVNGSAVWLAPTIGSGQARTVDGHKISGGLDHAGHVALDPSDPNKGFIGFLVEDKNVRSTVYPYHIEVWDLLVKAAALPNRVPILVAPRIYWTTYRLFSAIGALGIQTTKQWFAPEPVIQAAKFNKVVGDLALIDSAQLSHPDRPSKPIGAFFAKTVHSRNEHHPDQSLIEHSRDLWLRAAPICARPEYAALRKHNITNRQELYRQFVDELHAEGFDVGPLLPRHIVDSEGGEADDAADWYDFVDDDR
jgi:hypothetical protein